jgi:hypothetical protein
MAQAEAQAEKLASSGGAYPPPLYRSGIIGSRGRLDSLLGEGPPYGSVVDDGGAGGGSVGPDGLGSPVFQPFSPVPGSGGGSRRGSSGMGMFSPMPPSPTKYGGGGRRGGGGDELRSTSGLSAVMPAGRASSGLSGGGDSAGGGSFFGVEARSPLVIKGFKGPISPVLVHADSGGSATGGGGGGMDYDFGGKGKGRIKGAWV